jgi:hypothetical protein
VMLCTSSHLCRGECWSTPTPAWWCWGTCLQVCCGLDCVESDTTEVMPAEGVNMRSCVSTQQLQPLAGDA